MEQSETVRDLEVRGRDLRLRRSNWDQLFQDMQELVRPNSSDFTSSDPRPVGRERSTHLYDGTALWANEQLASGLHAHLTNPNERWFTLSVPNTPVNRLPRELRHWLEDVSDILFYEYGKSSSGFSPAMHEAYLDLGALGTCVLLQEWNPRKGGLQFQAMPLSGCYLGEGAYHEISQVWRDEYYTTISLRDTFPDISGEDAERVAKASPMKQWTVTHAVFNTSDRTLPGTIPRSRKEFTSVYYCLELEAPLSVGGFDEFPYHVGRWTKLAGEMYGRSPASTCLPDIRQVNQMVKEILSQAMFSNSPPMVLERDGFMLPLKWKPRSLIWKEPGYNDPQMLDNRSQPMVSLEMLQDVREHILRCFFVDWLVQEQKRARQTTIEVMDKRDEKLRMLAPVLGRLQSEMLDEMLVRSYNLLRRQRKLPPPPIPGVPLQVVYISPAAKAQFGSKVLSYQRFIEDLVALSQLPPDSSIFQYLDMPELVNEFALARDASPRIVRSREAIEREQKQQKQQSEALGAVNAAPNAARALKDLAQAKSTSPDLVNQVLPQ